MIYKVYEQFGDAVCYATEQGVIELANNDRAREDGTQAEEFTKFEDAKKFIEEEKLLEIATTEFEELEQAKEYLVQQDADFQDYTENYIVANY